MKLNKWNSQKTKLLKNMVNVVGIVIEIIFFHTNKKLFACHVVTT